MAPGKEKVRYRCQRTEGLWVSAGLGPEARYLENDLSISFDQADGKFTCASTSLKNPILVFEIHWRMENLVVIRTQKEFVLQSQSWVYDKHLGGRYFNGELPPPLFIIVRKMIRSPFGLGVVSPFCVFDSEHGREQ